MKNIWIGIDDTDSTSGGCTTYIARLIIEKLIKKYDIIGFPRLVRLNPNVPWKTRGNGAISFQVGIGDKKKIKIGNISGSDIFSCVNLKSDLYDVDVSYVKSIVDQTIKNFSKMDDENTNPGFVLLKQKPNFSLYDKAVKKIVLIDDIIDLLNDLDADFLGYKNKRGLIGAASSIAWDSKIDKTYELITYRNNENWGKKRFVDNESVKFIDKSITSTFDNFDYVNNHNRIMPNSPCPILYGIRGDDFDDLKKSLSIVKSEFVNSYIIFETNQGTDDHLVTKNISEIRHFESVIIKGTVVEKPITIKGGHVFFKVKDEHGIIDCAAYEPTKDFRDIIRELYVGDLVKVYGGVRQNPLTVNIEKLQVIKLVKIKKKIENPICSKCNKHMKSIGKDQGYRCKTCGDKSSDSVFTEINRKIKTGYYEVPVCARRHLSMPLKRYKKLSKS